MLIDFDLAFLYQAEHDVGYLRIELFALVVLQLADDHFLCQVLSVHTVGVHSVKGIRYADHACDKRNILAGFSLGIALAVVSLVVIQGALVGVLQALEAAEYLSAADGMRLYYLVLFVG